MRAQPGRLRVRAGRQQGPAPARRGPRRGRRRWSGSRAGPTKVRRFGEFAYAAKTWDVERRVIARVEASDKGADSRFVVTNLAGTPRWLYEVVYCARGQAENLVKAHKLHLASDRTSCSKATANQFRLVLHTAAYWLLHTLRGLAPKRSFWRDGPVRHAPPGADQGGRRGSPSWRPGSSSRCRPAIPTSGASCCSPPGPRGRPEPRGGVPRPSPSPATPSPDHRASGATVHRVRGNITPAASAIPVNNPG